jgi:hypothetical protein
LAVGSWQLAVGSWQLAVNFKKFTSKLQLTNIKNNCFRKGAKITKDKQDLSASFHVLESALLSLHFKLTTANC